MLSTASATWAGRRFWELQERKASFLTLLADQLVASGVYSTVVIVPFAVAGTPIALWGTGGSLNEKLSSVLASLPSGYKVTEMIWHQGESDYESRMATADYVERFRSFLATLRAYGVLAPVFIAIASKCRMPWNRGNAVAAAQLVLIDDWNVFLGADTDSMLLEDDRYDNCHMSESGMRKTAAAFFSAIEQRRRSAQGR
ncbi:sialate O-acetylesterase [uncultured Reyranella sp.]|uniref:sialate O-acetylesterase n=1 Tax=uncultured Reyranella sp. TaxID=735512 RepID=UPI0025FCDD73|nr:sialate O-acetylesterase [uncultured Reyranella sp.]